MLKAADGSESSALRRWAETLRWRCDIGDQALMERPYPKLERIAKHYPMYLHSRDRQGHMTYWEKLGHVNVDELAAMGLTNNDFRNLYIWSTIFTWDVAARDDEDKVTLIVDLDGLSSSIITPGFIGNAIYVAKLTAKHFPCREAGIYYINAPSFVEKAYRMIAPFVSKSQLDQVNLVSPEATPGVLSSLIAPENLPPEYGGEGPALGSAEVELRKRRLAATGSA